MPDTELELHVTPDMAHFTRMARENPKARFNSLMGLLSRTEGLRASFDSQPIRKAVGVGGNEGRLPGGSRRANRCPIRPSAPPRV